MNRAPIRRAWILSMAAVWVVAAGSVVLEAQPPPVAFDRVEEDWELVIDQTDLVSEGPQITTVMSPTGDKTKEFLAFNLNYRSLPSYSPGGLEVIAYDGEFAESSSTQHTDRLATQGETITWTQSMRLSGGALSYEIVNGIGTTWNRFGQGSGVNLGVSGLPYSGTLSEYDPDDSVANSGVGWQCNLVGSMRLLRVRYYSGGQVVAVDENARPVDLWP